MQALGLDLPAHVGHRQPAAREGDVLGADERRLRDPVGLVAADADDAGARVPRDGVAVVVVHAEHVDRRADQREVAVADDVVPRRALPVEVRGVARAGPRGRRRGRSGRGRPGCAARRSAGRRPRRPGRRGRAGRRTVRLRRDARVVSARRGARSSSTTSPWPSSRWCAATRPAAPSCRPGRVLARRCSRGTPSTTAR